MGGHNYKGGSMRKSLVVTKPFCIFSLVGLGFEFRSLGSTTCTTAPVCFALSFLEMGSCKLYAQDGLKLQSSQSQPSK
jgi:signal transduction protein with GAF and PtsI domain